MESTVKFTTYALAPDVWQINETGAGQDVDSYLIVGSERAMLVDSLMSRGDRRLYDIVREKTDKPIVVVHTHAHGDHVGAELREFIDAGCEIWLGEHDFGILGGFGASYPKEPFKALTDGQRISLGDRTLEVIEVAGHTPGSVVFLDRDRRQMFSGDTVGSGPIWLQLPHSVRLGEFCENLKRLEAEIAPIHGLVLYTGHRSQSPVQLTGMYVTHMRELVEMILSGEYVGDEVPFMGERFPNARTASYGLVNGLVYSTENM